MDVVVSTTEAPRLKTNDINDNGNGFRRSLSLVFDETSNENGMTFSTKFEKLSVLSFMKVLKVLFHTNWFCKNFEIVNKMY